MVRNQAEEWMSARGRKSSHVVISYILVVYAVGWKDSKCALPAEGQSLPQRRLKAPNATTKPIKRTKRTKGTRGGHRQ